MHSIRQKLWQVRREVNSDGGTFFNESLAPSLKSAQFEVASQETNFIQVASVVEDSIVDGPGRRLVIFVQGCPHKCPGCHNPSTHLLVGGKEYSVGELVDIYRSKSHLRGITFSGGEPFLYAQELALIAQEVHKLGGDVISYTGYYWHKLLDIAAHKASSPYLDPAGVKELLQHIDLLVDGPFVWDKKTLEEAFVGSSNQRLIALSSLGNRLLVDLPAAKSGSKAERVFFP